MIFKLIANVCVGSRYALDEVIAIVRPVVYVWAVMKYGRKSYTPIKLSAVLDILQIVIGVTRLFRSRQQEHKQGQIHAKKQHLVLNDTEKTQIKKRIQTSITKYLVRDPIWSQHIVTRLEKYCRMIRIPQFLVASFISIVNYQRIYCYIA